MNWRHPVLRAKGLGRTSPRSDGFLKDCCGSAQCILVSDVGREELPETFRGLRLRQEQRRRPSSDGRQIAESFEGNDFNRFGAYSEIIVKMDEQKVRLKVLIVHPNTDNYS
jgi:hypothetical protein